MANDRNSYAKRQREADKKRKAVDKRERRVKKKLHSDDATEPGESPSLSTAENSVLEIFRNYMMSPGKMLCFTKAELETFELPLAELADKGLLDIDQHRGAYSLTDDGFAAMKQSRAK